MTRGCGDTANARAAPGAWTLDEGRIVSPEPVVDVLALDRALEVLAAVDERKSPMIELRFFGGLRRDLKGEATL